MVTLMLVRCVIFHCLEIADRFLRVCKTKILIEAVMGGMANYYQLFKLTRI